MASASFTFMEGTHGIFIVYLRGEKWSSGRMEKAFGLLLCRRPIAGHPEVPAQFLNGRHSRGDRHFLCNSGECVVQTPGVPGAKLVHEWFEIEIRRLWKKANCQDSLEQDIAKNSLPLAVRQ